MHALEIFEAARRKGPSRKRLGRGIGSGHGKTAGRGHKGAGCRSGTKLRLGHEGGQMPLFRRLAKRGFSTGRNSPPKGVSVVNVGDLNDLSANVTTVTIGELISGGLIPRRTRMIRVLGSGTLNRGLVVEAQFFSKTAAEKIVRAGGTVVLGHVKS
jgi:large subunit ribosomal protein L15